MFMCSTVVVWFFCWLMCLIVIFFLLFFFFFYFFFFFIQAEDGIRDWSVTGVQTCALPISLTWSASSACPDTRLVTEYAFLAAEAEAAVPTTTRTAVANASTPRKQERSFWLSISAPLADIRRSTTRQSITGPTPCQVAYELTRQSVRQLP